MYILLELMKRKVVKTGQNTLIISLPSNWIKKYKIEKGQSIEIEENAGLLKIYPTIKTKKKKAIKLENEGYWYINRLLRKLYAAGYDEIEVEYSSNSQMEFLRKGTTYLEGFEVMKSEKNKCIVRNLLKTRELDYLELLDNIIWLIHSQLEIFLEYLTKKDNKSLKEINGINESVIKLAHLGRRVLNLECKQDLVILKDSFLVFTNLLYLSSYLTFASKEIIKNKINLDKEEADLIVETKSLYEDLIYAYRNKDIDKIQNFFQERNRTFDRDINLLNKKNPSIVHFFLNFRKEMVAIGNYSLTMSFEDNLS